MLVSWALKVQYHLCGCSCLAGTCEKTLMSNGLNMEGKESSSSCIFKYYSVRLLHVWLSPESSL